jgi:alpha-1,6-mannosyltransferase
MAVLGAASVGVTAVQASLHVPGELGIGSYGLLVRFVALWALSGVLYAFAVVLALRAHGRAAVVLVVAVAAALRVIPFLEPPFLSTDIYRYVWDGRVQNAGFNPYCCIPADPVLAALQDDAIFSHVNRADYAPTIYPPVAQMFFAAVARVSETVGAMKLAMLAAETLAIITMIALLGVAGLPQGRALIYAWHPLAVWEYGGNGHVDALAIAFIGLALLATARRRQALAGLALAAAVLTKFLPLVIAPALWRAREWSRWWHFPAAGIVTVLAAYGVYASVGWRVFGFLSGYSQEEGISDGAGVFLLQLLTPFMTLPPWSGIAWLSVWGVILTVAGLAAIWAGTATRTIAQTGQAALVLATIATVALSPHYAWYYGWLAYLSCLAPFPSVIFLTIACVACYLDTDHTNIGWATAITAVFACLAARDVWCGTRRREDIRST